MIYLFNLTFVLTPDHSVLPSGQRLLRAQKTHLTPPPSEVVAQAAVCILFIVLPLLLKFTQGMGFKMSAMKEPELGSPQ